LCALEFKLLPSPPILPKHYVHRKLLLEKVKTMIYENLDQMEEYVTLILTGAPGFGKTTLAIALCNHPDMKEVFTDGIVWIELGTQAKHPKVILNDLYCRMTGRNFEYINDAEDKIRNLTKHFRNMLVIIDDVWEADNAKILIKAFPYSKIIITTRVSNLSIPVRQKVDVGSMTIEEAVYLMTNEIIEYDKISNEDEKTLYEIAQNVHHWPLLLLLIRGQLQYNLIDNKVYVTPHHAIQKVQANLMTKGLVAFDRPSMIGNRQQSVRVCIEVSLNMLDDPTRTKLISMMLYTGIDGSMPKEVLYSLWNLSKEDASAIIDKLEAYGLASNKDVKIPPFYNACVYLTIHAVISHYVLSSVSATQIFNLSPFFVNTEKLVVAQEELVFKKYYGLSNIMDLTKIEYLIYNQQKMEHVILPYYVKDIIMHVLHDPNLVILILQNIQSILINAGSILEIFSPQIISLLCESYKALSHGLILSREFNTQFQLFCSKMNFENLVITLTKYLDTPFITSVIADCIELTKNIASCCDGKLKSDLIEKGKELTFLTKEYHCVSLEKLPRLQLYIKLHSEISMALLNDDVNTLYKYISSGKFEEDVELVHMNYCIKINDIGLPGLQDFSADNKSELFNHCKSKF